MEQQQMAVPTWGVGGVASLGPSEWVLEGAAAAPDIRTRRKQERNARIFFPHPWVSHQPNLGGSQLEGVMEGRVPRKASWLQKRAGSATWAQMGSVEGELTSVVKAYALHKFP